MDYPCAKFSDFSFSRLGFIVRTDRQTDRITHRRYSSPNSLDCRRRAWVNTQINWVKIVVVKFSRNKRKRQPIGMLGRSSGNHDWLLANVSACVSCGFSLRNARNASDCVWMETGLKCTRRRAGDCNPPSVINIFSGKQNIQAMTTANKIVIFILHLLKGQWLIFPKIHASMLCVTSSPQPSLPQNSVDSRFT